MKAKDIEELICTLDLEKLIKDGVRIFGAKNVLILCSKLSQALEEYNKQNN